MGKEKVSYVGKRFGRLTVVERVDNALNPNGKSVIRYRCKCDCGNETIVRKSSSNKRENRILWLLS